MKWLVVAGGIAVGSGACSKAPSAAPEVPAKTQPEVATPVPAPIDLRTLELETTPADDAEHGRWVRCAGGQLEGGGQRFSVCADASQTWPDPKRGEVAFVATASHAFELEVAGRRGRFVEGRARVVVALEAMGAGTVEGDERKRTIAVRVTGEAHDLEGTIVLVAPAIDGVPPAPKAVEALAPLVRFAGLDAQTTRAQLLDKLGTPTSVGPTAGGVEMIAFGAELGALVDAVSGKVVEIWIVGDAGRRALRQRGLDDPMLALVDAPLARATEVLGPPTRTGMEFVSWALEKDGLTIYLELSCEPEGEQRCHELDVGWLTRPTAP